MNNSHEVISAFLDDRPFELQDLAVTLEDPKGRALLIDLLALRRLVQPSDAIPSAPAAQPWGLSWVRSAVAAAAVVVALAGGYLMGVKRGPEVAEAAAPAPTRIVEVTTTWQDMPTGGQR